MKSIKLRTACLVVASASAVLFGSSAMSQSDSSNVPALRGTPIVPLRLQQRETPVVNNITQVTQIISPTTYQNSGSAGGIGLATAAVGCNGSDSLVGGGGSCSDGAGLVAIASSVPYTSNGWYIGCQSLNGNPLTATVYAVCSMANP